MSVFKATKNKKEEGKNSSNDTFKATKNRSYDSTMVYSWEKANKESIEILNTITTKSNNNEYVSSEELDTYRKALDSYIDSSSKLRDVSKWYGMDIDDDETWKNTVTALNSDYDTLQKYWSNWENEDAYNKYQIGWLDTYTDVNEENIAARREYYQKNVDRISEIDKELEGIGYIGWWDYFSDKPKRVQELHEERNNLVDENTLYDNVQKVLDDNYIPITDEEEIITWTGDYSNASKDELKQYENEFRQLAHDINLEGGYDVDAYGNIIGVNITLGNSKPKIIRQADAITEAYLKNETGYGSQFFNSVVEDKLGCFLNAVSGKGISGGSGAARDTIDIDYTTARGDGYDYWEKLMQEGDTNGWLNLRPEEIRTYYYKLENEGQESAYKFLDDMAVPLTYRSTMARAKEISKAPVLEQIGLNILSIPMNILGGVPAFVEDVTKILSGNRINPYSRAHFLQNDAGAIRTDTAQDIDKATGNAAIPWIDFSLGDAYQAGMSGLDSLAGATFLGGTGYGALMGMGATSSTMKELYERGATNQQMLAGGILAGAAEMVFEKISIDHFVKMGDTKSLKDAVINILKQGGIEASEEAFTEIANIITDAYVMGSQADVHDLETFVKNVVNAGLGGFLSGGGMGMVHSAVNGIQNYNQTKKDGQEIIDKGGVESLKNSAATLTDNKTVSKLLDRLSSKMSARNVGKLADAVQTAVETRDRTAIIDELQKSGLSKKEAEKVADFSVKVSQGYEASESEIAEIEKITDKLPDVSEDSTAAEDAQIAQGSTEAGKSAAEVQNGSQSENSAVQAASENDADTENVTLESVSKKYGAQAGAMIHTYKAGQDVAKFDAAYKVAFDMGKAGVSLDYVMKSEATSYLTETQKELAHETGRAAAGELAQRRAKRVSERKNGNTGRKEGVVKGEGVKIEDLTKRFNDPQRKAYKVLSTIAKITGIDIVLYASEKDADGNFVGDQGKFVWKEDTIYIDINAGLENIKSVGDLSAYTMLRTFTHEFVHFIEKYDAVCYNELRELVFAKLTERGENVDELIILKQGNNMSYDAASREVVAESLTDILPDSTFIEELATEHKRLFERIVERLKEFLSDIKAYFASLDENPNLAARALKEQVGDSVKYLEDIVELFDKAAKSAVENYQAAVATEENISENDTVNSDYETLASYGLTDEEIYAVLQYKSSESYKINKKLYSGEKLTKADEKLIRDLDSALEKIPVFKGTVYRNMTFDSKESLIDFLRGHASKTNIQYLNYLSSSKVADGYEVDGDYVVHTEIETLTGKDLSNVGIVEEQEVLLPRDATFDLIDIQKENGQIYIKLQEVDHGQERTDKGGEFGREITEGDSRDRSGARKEQTDDGRGNSRTIQEQIHMPSESKIDDGRGQAEVKTTVSENGYTVTDDQSGRVITIKFEGKPTTEVRDMLKGNAFVWNRTKGVWLRSGQWYGKNNAEDVIAALDVAYKTETQKVEPEKEKFSTEKGGKTTRTKKSDWSAHDVQWLIPGKKTPIAYSTVATSDLIEALSEQYPKATISQLMSAIKYDVDAKRVVQQYINAGYGDQVAYDWFLRDFGKKESTTSEKITDTEEIEVNVENVDSERSVSQPVESGQGDTRLLDEIQDADVLRDERAGDSVGDLEESGRDVLGNGDRTDAARSPRVRGNGDSESGDLRRASELTEEESNTIHDTVETQIEEKSSETPKGKNFVIGETLALPDGEKARYRANVDAIRLIKKLESEARFATDAEQEILSKYVGWGGLSSAFGESVWNREKRQSEMVAKKGWEKEFAELRALVDDGTITEEEYKAMSASTKNAHYTSIEVIRAMYDGLLQLGFEGGRVLEPSAGVGNFIGAMPTDMSAKVKSTTMVELDRITGLIAKYLYPNADVRIQGFETANIPNNYMDVAIGNVPFGNFGVVDRTYPKRITKAIHNYFFAKSLDKVREGGIVMFITSSFTMNSSDSGVRQYIMDRADLLGAIRLPNTAFKGNAGTEVVTDILVLKKRKAGTEYAGESFLESPYNYNYGDYINSYFSEHPEMVLGTPVNKRGMYNATSLTYDPFTDRGSLGNQIRKAFDNIKGKMDYPAVTIPEKANFAVERENKKAKHGAFVVHSDGSISINDNGELKKYDTDAATAKRIAGILSVRDAYRQLVAYLQQGQDAKYIKQARKALNDAYDKFVKEHGYLNSPKNKAAIVSDPDYFAILALENYDAKTKTSKKSDIFSKDTISANKTVARVDSVREGVIASVNLKGGIDTAFIAKLTGKTESDVTRELIDSRLAFKSDGELVSREVYLSGNVRAKLRHAEALAPLDKDYENNIEELRAVLPKDVPYSDIYVTPGATFIPNEIYADFIAEMLGGFNRQNSYSAPDVEVGRTVSGEYKIKINSSRLKGGYLNRQKWGTARRSFLDLIDSMMNSRSVTVNDAIEDAEGRKRLVVNKVETAAANEKVEEIKKAFEEWLWRDETRRNEVARLYNEVFNALVTPKYDGSHLTVNGLNAEFSLRPHQADAVQRIISSGGNTLLAHKVGAGKTLEMAAAAMKLRELGIVKKPMFVVPKSLVAQWGVEFHSYFPAARILVADEKSFTAANRKTFSNRIANGDYDAIIVSYEQFEKVPMSVEFQKSFYEEQINDIINAIAEERAESRDGKGLTVKEMEKKRAQLEKKLAELSTKAKDENNIDFEMLGVDSLFVDEAHNFKNLQYITRMNNISGLGNQNGSQRAFDLFTKVRYLQGLNGGRGIVFATATPVMNSMAEMYIMQRYLQSDMLQRLGLVSFDAWAKQFGEVVNSIEIKPSGQGFRVKQTFSNFRNLNELQMLFRSFSDVLTTVPGLKIPKMRGGAVKVVVCEPGVFQKDYMKQLEERAEKVRDVDPSVDNMLKITSDGRKISYTQRMIDPTLPYELGCKIYRCCENVFAEYKDSASIKGTQIIFCDMATPKGKSKTATESIENDDSFDTESAKLYEDMRAYLVKLGIPAKEIAFIHDADTDIKKKQLFEDVNNGKVRVLIGSTGKMGVGMNAQKRIVAIHHLDAPWRPGDVEQRDGRAFRQKNMNDEVSKYTYVTEGTFDARLWDILDRKQHFINQIMNGEDVGRSAEDTGEVTLSAAEVKALASGNPLIMEQVQLTNDIQKLEDLQKAHMSEVRRAKVKLAEDEQKISSIETRIAKAKEDIKSRVDTYSDGKFSMKIGKSVFADKKDAGTALVAEIKAKVNKDAYIAVGSFAGFEIRVIQDGIDYSGMIVGKQGYKFNVYPNNSTYMINHICNIVSGLEDMIKNNEQILSDLRTDREAQAAIIEKPFSKQAELEEKRARFNEVMEILNPKEEQQLDSADEDLVQSQSREYLRGEIYESIQDGSTGKLDNSRIGRRNETQNAQEQTSGSRENVQMVGGNSNSGRGHLRGSKKALRNSEGGRGQLNKHALEKLEGTVVVDVNGSPMLVYHATDVEFDTFEKGDIGFHFGNFAQAKERANQRNIDSPRFVKAYLSIKNPIYSQRDTMSWRANATALNLWSMDIITEKERDEVLSLWERCDDEYNSKAAVCLREIITSKGYDGIIYPNNFEGVGDSYIVFSDEQVIRENDDDIQQYQQRRSTLTDREVLELAADEISVDGLTEGEVIALQIFKDKLSKLRDLQDTRAELGRTYKEQQFGEKVDRAEAEKTLNRMHVLDAQIEKSSLDLLSVEEKKVLSGVLKKARKVIENQQRAHDAEVYKRYIARQKDAANVKKYRDRIAKDVKDMSEWVLHPDNKNVIKHIPDVLKDTVIPFITSIDFTSKNALAGRAATKADKIFKDRLEKLTKAIKQITPEELYSGKYDLSPNFLPNLEKLIEATKAIAEQNGGEFVINKMTAEELAALSQVVRNLKSFVKQVNRFLYNSMIEYVSEAGDSSISAMSEMSDATRRSAAGNSANRFVMWQNIRPAYAFERFGDGGIAIYDGLRRGQAQLAFNTQKIIDFANKTYTSKQVKEWSEKWLEFETKGGSIRMPVAMAMSFCELAKQDDSLRHILAGGVRVATTKDVDKKVRADSGHILTEDDVRIMLDKLANEYPEAVKVADAMQKFMAQQGGEWGNYVSIKRFGEELFGNPQYFPINSDGQHLESTLEESPEAASLYALLNMSFTKSRNEKAKNRIILYNIFDVFANHMASMAQYNALALPVLDAVKWLNYQQKGITSVREQMDRAYGVPVDTRTGSGNKGHAQMFVINVLKSFNGTAAQGTPYDGIGMKALHLHSAAQIAYNLRVVIQQPLAITRAGMIIDYKSIIKGMKLTPKNIKQNIAEMRKYSGIAAWKALGFYDVNISKGVTQLIKHEDNAIDKVVDIGLWGAETADTLTWAAIWSACKEEVERKQKLHPSDSEYYETVAKLFEEIIYKTQVVDSILTKSEFLRSKGLFARATGAFMSEPSATLSMALDAFDKFHIDRQKGLTYNQAWQKHSKRIVRTIAVYAIGSVLLAAIQAIADGLRDDDDYESLLEKWLEAFGGNLIDEVMPINKLPILSDFYDLAKALLAAFGVDTYGNPPQSVFMQWYDSLIKGSEIIHDKLVGEDTNYTWYGGIYKLLQAASSMSGLPLGTATREIVVAWNNTIGAMAPSLKVKSYDSGDKSNIRYAYEDGYLTKQEAIEKLQRDAGLSEKESISLVNKWTCKIVTGISYEDIKSQYLSGKISRSRAIEMLMLYGGKTRAEATRQVERYDKDK